MTTKRNPREVLGVRADASLASCQKAYRRLVMELHPDRNLAGETAERFKKVQDAWDQLNGKDSQAALVDAKATANLCTLFISVTGEMLDKGTDPTKVDVKAKMRGHLADHKKQVGEKIMELTKQTDLVKKMVGRWRSKSGDLVPLEQVLLAKIADCDAVLARFAEELSMVERSLALLDGWEYQQDKEPLAGYAVTFAWQRTGSTTTVILQ